ncbi:MAG TPA: transglutaminase-like domain-containing protein [Gemmatales bacterium]|nr:transglutaminase-like domain-containing protein [Gemmatales bacterium]
MLTGAYRLLSSFMTVPGRAARTGSVPLPLSRWRRGLHAATAAAIGLVIVLIIHALALAQEPARAPRPRAPVSLDVWEAIWIDSHHVGWCRRQTRAAQANGVDVVETAIELELGLRRDGRALSIHQVHAFHESIDGRLLGFILQDQIGPEQQITRKGRVQDDELIWTTQWRGQPAREKSASLPKNVRGPWGQMLELKRGPSIGMNEPGWHRYEPVFDAILPVDVGWQPADRVELPQQPPQRLRSVILRLDGVPDAPEAMEQWWLDVSNEVVLRKQRHASLGTLTFVRTTPEKAKVGMTRAFAFDVGKAQLIRLNRPLADFNATAEATYRVRLKEGDKAPAIPSSDRQKVQPDGPQAVTVQVIGLETPPDLGPTRFQPPAGYLTSNAVLNAKDAIVRRHAQEATRGQSRPWAKAQAIERWVHRQLRGKPESSEGHARADEVARRLAGDCKAHAILAAAMCRAVDIPARTAVGLVYVPKERALGFHMWLEVWIDGRWYALDPTLGEGRVGAGHLKLGDQDWNDANSLAPLQAVLNLIGNLEVELVAAP